jgi:hypothetical protein
MRNHSFLYLLRPDGEEGELQRIAESNSVFPSLWKILFACGRLASDDVRRVLKGTASLAIEVDAEAALERLGHFTRLLTLAGLARPVRVGSQIECEDDVDAALHRYLEGAQLHLRELIDEWSFDDGARPVLCADFDERLRPDSAPEVFLKDQLSGFARLWGEITRAGESLNEHSLESLFDFRASNLRVTDWRAWSGLFGLALFEHDYFYQAFRKPFRCDYADYDYDPLGVDDDLGRGLHRVRIDGRWGVHALHASEVRVVIEAKWDRILRASSGDQDAVWVKRGAQYGLAALRGPNAGALLLDPVLDEVGHFEDGVAPVRLGSQMGFLRSDGSWLLKPAWDRVWPFRHGRALVEADHGLTYIDALGVAISKISFDEAEHFTEHGVARVGKAGRYGLVTREGDLALDLEYAQVQWSDEFQGWLCAREGLITLVHGDGRRWLDEGWEQIDVCEPGRVMRVRRGNHFGLLDWAGRAIVTPQYHALEPLSSGLLLARVASRVGVIDTRGVCVVPFEFSRIEPLPADISENALTDFLLVYSLPDRARPKAGIWDLRRGRLHAPCQYDRETLPAALMQLAMAG